MWCTNSLTFNNCTFCPHCIYVFCIYVRANSDLCHLQHKLIGFYNRDEKCLLRGTNWVFKESSLRVVFEGLINTRYVISRRRLPSALFVTVSFIVVENPCRYGEATDVMHCVENYVTGKPTSGSGISLHTEKDNFFLRNLFEIFFLQPTSCPFCYHVVWWVDTGFLDGHST